MELRYHQRTFNLITQTQIDPQKAIDAFDKYEEPTIFRHYAQSDGKEIAKEKTKEWRNTVLAWTALDLYQRPVRFSEENIHKLDALEQEYGISLPASVREWYSLDICPEIMSVWDAEGYPPMYFRIEEIKPNSEINTATSEHISAKDSWKFLHAEYVEQGGETIKFQVNAGDDPPVFAYDQMLESSFSQFIYLHFWKWLARYTFEEGCHIHSDRLLGPPEQYWISLSNLREHLSEVESDNEWIFFNDYVRVFASRSDVLNPQMITGGSFRTNNWEELQKLFKNLWGQNLPAFFMHPQISASNSEPAITAMQKDQLRHILLSAEDWMTTGEIASDIGATIPGKISQLQKILDWLVHHNHVEFDAGATPDTRLTHRYRWNVIVQ